MSVKSPCAKIMSRIEHFHFMSLNPNSTAASIPSSLIYYRRNNQIGYSLGALTRVKKLWVPADQMNNREFSLGINPKHLSAES